MQPDRKALPVLTLPAPLATPARLALQVRPGHQAPPVSAPLVLPDTRVPLEQQDRKDKQDRAQLVPLGRKGRKAVMGRPAAVLEPQGRKDRKASLMAQPAPPDLKGLPVRKALQAYKARPVQPGLKVFLAHQEQVARLARRAKQGAAQLDQRGRKGQQGLRVEAPVPLVRRVRPAMQTGPRAPLVPKAQQANKAQLDSKAPLAQQGLRVPLVQPDLKVTQAHKAHKAHKERQVLQDPKDPRALRGRKVLLVLLE